MQDIATLSASPRCLLAIKNFEAVAGKPNLVAYRCPAGVLTIGYGHTTAAGMPLVTPGMQITVQEAERIFMADVAAVEGQVRGCVKVRLDQGMYDALISFVFNFGIGNLKSSTLMRRLNAGDYVGAGAELNRWVMSTDPATGQKVKLNGLVKRRAIETSWWNDPTDDALDPLQAAEQAPSRAADLAAVPVEEMRATPVTPDPVRSMATSKEGAGAILSGGAVVLGAGQQVVDQVQQANGLISALQLLVTQPMFWVLLVGAGAAAAVWWLRRDRMLRDGT